MPDKITISLATSRLKQARECLESADRELIAKSYKSAANRSYYCIFHAIRAVLALDRFDSKKHSGLIAEFRKKYIKTNIFPPEASDVIRDAFDIRNNSDYEDFFVISKKDVSEQIENARSFLIAADGYVNKFIDLS